MKKQSILIIIVGFCLAGAIYAGVSQHQADMAREAVTAPNDPKKKKAGEECKSSDECQRHHSCEQAGDKSVCVAPKLSDLPKT